MSGAARGAVARAGVRQPGGAAAREGAGETREARLRRLGMRSWRRGIRECDLILGGWADAHLAALDAAELDAYEALLVENDHDIYAWIAGSAPAPADHARLVSRIAVESVSTSRQV